MDEVISSQGKIDSLLNSQIEALGADALVVLHQSGQILARSQSKDADLATLAALMAGMMGAAQSIAEIQGLKTERSFSLAHDDGESGLYGSQINRNYWIFSIFSDVLNPGLFRMNIRRLAIQLRDLVADPGKFMEQKAINEWEAARETENEEAEGGHLDEADLNEVREMMNQGAESIKSGDSLIPERHNAPKLFSDITDEEIDQLFDR